MKKYSYFLLLFFFMACGKDEPTSQNDLIQTDFPITEGSWWRYKVYDFISKNTDTLVFKINSKQSSGSILTYKCEIKRNNELIDTGVYKVSENRIEYTGKKPDYSYFGNFALQFPFKLNSKWQGFYKEDTVLINGKVDAITINGKIYKSVYTAKRAFFLSGGYSWVQDMLIVPKIGIIQQNYKEFNFGIVLQKDLSLLDYEIK